MSVLIIDRGWSWKICPSDPDGHFYYMKIKRTCWIDLMDSFFQIRQLFLPLYYRQRFHLWLSTRMDIGFEKSYEKLWIEIFTGRSRMHQDKGSTDRREDTSECRWCNEKADSEWRVWLRLRERKFGRKKDNTAFTVQTKRVAMPTAVQRTIWTSVSAAVHRHRLQLDTFVGNKITKITWSFLLSFNYTSFMCTRCFLSIIQMKIDKNRVLTNRVLIFKVWSDLSGRREFEECEKIRGRIRSKILKF